MQVYKLGQIEDSGSSPPGWHLLCSGKRGLQMGLLAAPFAYVYGPVFRALAGTWWVRDDYSHGFLVPLISLYLVWFRREKLRHLCSQPACLGGISVMIMAGAMLLVGEASGVITLEELSLVVMIAGLVLCLFGRDCLRAVGLPIAYLLFMIPITDELIAPLHWFFQLLTAKMGVAFLQMLGFSALVERQYIVLPSITLEVAQACSGIKYLISIVAIGIPLAYVSQKILWRRVILVVSAVIVGIVANWIRVIAIGIWAYYGGKVLHGPFHVLQALFVSQVGFVFLIAGAWLLSKIPAPSSKSVSFSPFEARREKSEAKRQHWLRGRSWAVALLTLLGLSAYLSLHERGPVPLKAEFASFPLSMGDWGGQAGDPQQAEFRVKGADNELLRVYGTPSGREIQVYVAYFESQHHSKEIINYLTARLHQNATWVDIPMDHQGSISVNQLFIRDGVGGKQIYFWYDINGRILANRYRVKLTTTLDALVYGRTNGAFVQVSQLLTGREEAEEIMTDQRALIRDLVPVLRRYLP